jgi:hypothetical protein
MNESLVGKFSLFFGEQTEKFMYSATKYDQKVGKTFS